MSDPTFSGTPPATAIADAILGVLQGAHWMNEINAFIRGANPMPIPQDLYPFVEVIVSTETNDAGLTGGYTERTYTGLIAIAEQVTKLSDADFLDPSVIAGRERQINVASADTITRLLLLVQALLGQETYHDLAGCTATWTVTHISEPPGSVTTTLTVTEVVTQFRLDGPIVYGVEDRGNNYENFGSIAFVVETQRAPIAAT